MDAEREEFWDPDHLRIGDRVLIRLSGECRWYHVKGQEGMTGMVDFRFSPEHYPDGHFYLVNFDLPVPTLDGKGFYGASAFARAELERIR